MDGSTGGIVSNCDHKWITTAYLLIARVKLVLPVTKVLWERKETKDSQVAKDHREIQEYAEIQYECSVVVIDGLVASVGALLRAGMVDKEQKGQLELKETGYEEWTLALFHGHSFLCGIG